MVALTYNYKKMCSFTKDDAGVLVMYLFFFLKKNKIWYQLKNILRQNLLICGIDVYWEDIV